MSYGHTDYYFKCDCDKWVKCSFLTECERKCEQTCSLQTGGHNAFIENYIGPPRDNDPPLVQSLYDLVPSNQPDDYNYQVAIGNPVHYSSQTQGLVDEYVDTHGFARR